MQTLHKSIVKTLSTIPDYALFGSIIGTITMFIQKYLFSDFDYLKYLCIAILLDTFLALIYHARNGSISSSGIDKFTVKIIAYASALILMHLLESFTIKGVHYEIQDFPSHVMYGIFFYRELVSIAEKIEAVRPNTLPGFLVKFLKLKKYE